MRFQLNSTVHYGYLRVPGVYDDLSEADIRALARYGVPIEDHVAPEITPPASPSEPAMLITVPSDDPPSPTEPTPPAPETEQLTAKESSNADPEPPRPDDPPAGPTDAGPFICNGAKGCFKKFPSEVALSTHRKQKKH